jgi:hypothetical protein
MDIRPVENLSKVQICDFWFHPPCLCETQSRWSNDLHMCGSHCEAWKRCDGVGVLCWWHCQYCQWFIQAHLTSVAATAFCSDTPSHLWDNHLFFNRTMTQNTSRLWKGYLTEKESDGVLHQTIWPPITQPQPSWDGLGWIRPQSEWKAANKCSAYVETSRIWSTTRLVCHYHVNTWTWSTTWQVQYVIIMLLHGPDPQSGRYSMPL